ncbi:MAG: flagellar type III secretion system pore protein FliP [Verrucomicrobium sp.]|nr:flagellar type III secretion system pore protein FliP [Verrucomicrobium sp.]
MKQKSFFRGRPGFWALVLGLALAFLAVPAQAAPGDTINFSLNTGSGGGANMSVSLQLLVLFTILSLAPGIMIMTTCFVRIVIVLSFLRNALTLQTPPNQVVIGLALFLTFYIMQPTWDRISKEAIDPVRDNKITFQQGMDKAVIPLKEFMLRYAGEQDLRLFLSMSPTPITLTTPEALPISVVVPAFMLSELKRGFEMGLLILLPFLVIDMVVASILMALGMMMLPPSTVSLPVKLMVFVLVDGWTLVVRSLVDSFRVS